MTWSLLRAGLAGCAGVESRVTPRSGPGFPVNERCQGQAPPPWLDRRVY
jgi:hypothetical protein